MLKFQIWKILPLILIFAAGIFATPTQADPSILPNVQGSEPTIDGIINLTEWTNSLLFNTTVDGKAAQVRVTSNNDNLYIGFNYTAVKYTPVNSTSFNNTLSENLDTHDWLVLQFDNNLDKKNLGSAENPDDVVVVDQYKDETYDGYANGTSYLKDVTQDGSYTFVNNTNDLTYEFSKPLESGDKNGSDISIARSVMQFKFNYYTNETSNSTAFTSTEWFTFRVNETGTGFALKSVSDVFINLNIVGNDGSDFIGLETSLVQYGFKVDYIVGNLTIKESDLNIIILNDDATIKDEQLNELVSYIELGGKVMIFLSSTASAASQKIADKFNMNFINTKIKDANNNTELKMSNSINEHVFLKGPSNVTDKVIENVQFESSGLNTTLMKSKSSYIFRQRYDMIDLFDSSDLKFASKTVSNITLAATFDLLKTGRVSLFASNDIVSNNQLTNADNLHMLLRLVPWNARLVNTIQINSLTLDKHTIMEDEKFTYSANVTDGFGNNNKDFQLLINLEQAHKAHVSITANSTDVWYNGTLQTKGHGNMEITTVAFLRGYGFAEGQVQHVFIDTHLDLYNKFSDLSPWIAIPFALSVFLVYLSIVKTKKKN